MTEVGRRYVPIRRTLKKASLPARVVLLADLIVFLNLLDLTTI
jgi:hypothetical protein